MFTNTIKNKKGFTLIELLVVISIIGLLSSVVLASLNSARSKSMDARRKSDLTQIRTALLLYYDKYGNYISTGSGCGYGGNGQGWFNYVDGINYVNSIVSCLVTNGFLSSEIKDPTGGLTSSPTSGYTYMKYDCILNGQSRVFIYAKLENIPQSTTATDNTCASSVDSSYGMNYYVSI